MNHLNGGSVNDTKLPSSSQPSGSTGNKTKVSTTIHTDSNSVNENGMTETTVTRIITEKYTDGTTSTRKETRTTREEQILGNAGQGYFQPITTIGSNNSIVGNSSGGQGQGQDRNALLNVSSPHQQISYQAPGYFVDPRSPKASLETEEGFIQQALLTHNRYRARHSAPPLTIASELCQVAQSWANHLAESGVMSNSHYGYGENIYWSSAPTGNLMRGDVPVDYWYNEISQFDWFKMDFQRTTGAFTQVIWKSTNQIGVAKATGNKGTFVVAFYVPPGNVVGQFRQNVERAIM